MSLSTIEYLLVVSAIQKQIQQQKCTTQLEHTCTMIPHPVSTQCLYLEVAAAAPEVDVTLLLVSLLQEVSTVILDTTSSPAVSPVLAKACHQLKLHSHTSGNLHAA